MLEKIIYILLCLVTVQILQNLCINNSHQYSRFLCFKGLYYDKFVYGELNFTHCKTRTCIKYCITRTIQSHTEAAAVAASSHQRKRQKQNGNKTYRSNPQLRKPEASLYTIQTHCMANVFSI